MRFQPGKRLPIIVFTLWLVFLFSLCGLSIHALDTPKQASFIDTDIPCEWSGVDRIVAIGDLHGAYEHFVEILKGTGLIDSNLRWIGGKTHLVQIGDVLDRGDGAKEIFDLARRLEKEAEEAGGRVHMLIGNHEEMNLTETAFSREGYITPKQFVSFISDSYRINREKAFSRRAARKPSGDSSTDNGYDEYWQEIIDDARENPRHKGRVDYFETLNALYGDWILGHNVVIKINGIIFVHGGISLPFSQWSLKEINDQYRQELDDIRWEILRPGYTPKINRFDRQFYNEPNGPLWYRDLARGETENIKNELIQTLVNLEAKHMVIAHTPQISPGIDIARYEGRVYIIDTGIADYYRTIGGYLSALIYENGQFSRWPSKQNKREEDIQRKLRPDAGNRIRIALNMCFEVVKCIFYPITFENEGGV